MAASQASILPAGMGSRPAGMLLTGGTSRRMGRDKATLDVGGGPLAVRLGELLAAVAWPVVEVGPGRSSLPAVVEREAGEGPLVAICAGATALFGAAGSRPVIVLACDLPLLNERALRLLAQWPGAGAVVPVVDGRRQPLCARWALADLDAATRRASSGERSIGGLPGVAETTEIGEGLWATFGRFVFSDADAPADLERLGLAPARADASVDRAT